MYLNQKISHSLEIIKSAINTYPKIAVASSWGKDSLVTLHLCLTVNPDISVFTVLTPFKPPETIELKEYCKDHWKLNLKEYRSLEKVSKNLCKTNPDECCRILKVEPTKEAIKDLDAWITGLRNTEGKTRKDYQEIENKQGLVKINPILSWTELEIWRYTAFHQLPVHPWYLEGYRSLGCIPCTKKIEDSEPERAGRWAGTSKCQGECGIHSQILKSKLGGG